MTVGRTRAELTLGVLLIARHARLKNPYDVELVRDGARWLIRRIRIKCVWFTGNPSVITGDRPFGERS